MRIVAGRRKGMTLRVPEGLAVRPTPMRVREAAMSILGGQLDGWHVLDLCAGSGAIGLECASRGAARVLLVEPDRQALVSLRDNVARANFGPEVEVWPSDAASAIARAARQGARFDLVWLDPPWSAELHATLLQALAAAALIRPGGEVCVESERGVCDDSTPFSLIERRRYGSVVLERLAAKEPA